jgi:hypothetical protein
MRTSDQYLKSNFWIQERQEEAISKKEKQGDMLKIKEKLFKLLMIQK